MSAFAEIARQVATERDLEASDLLGTYQARHIVAARRVFVLALMELGMRPTAIAATWGRAPAGIYYLSRVATDPERDSALAVASRHRHARKIGR